MAETKPAETVVSMNSTLGPTHVVKTLDPVDAFIMKAGQADAKKAEKAKSAIAEGTYTGSTRSRAIVFGLLSRDPKIQGILLIVEETLTASDPAARLKAADALKAMGFLQPKVK